MIDPLPTVVLLVLWFAQTHAPLLGRTFYTYVQHDYITLVQLQARCHCTERLKQAMIS